MGFYKPVAGDGPCGKCPQHSHSETRAAVSCPCDSNYYRVADDPPAAPCSRKSNYMCTSQYLIPLVTTKRWEEKHTNVIHVQCVNVQNLQCFDKVFTLCKFLLFFLCFVQEILKLQKKCKKKLFQMMIFNR